MARRLKPDLRRLGEPFPERIVEAISIADLPERRESSRNLAQPMSLSGRVSAQDQPQRGPKVYSLHQLAL